MTDATAQPALPATEPAAGNEGAWSEQVFQARAAGRIDNLLWLKYEPAFARAREAHFAQGSQAPDLSQQQASARIAQLRQLRIDGKATPADVQEFERLAAQAAGETVEHSPQLSVDERLQAEIDVQMAPAQPHEYKFEYPVGYQPTEEDIAWDSDVRSVFSAAGIPKYLGGPIYDAVERVARESESASPETLLARMTETTGSLKKQWGADFDKRMEAVDDLVFEITEGSQQLAEIIYSMPWVLADISVWQHLDTFAQYKANKRRA